jgi:uncharacterized protein (DUF952 family)
MPIYHITTAEEAREAAAAGQYTPALFEREGFIHCSHAHQVPSVANRIFRGRTGLVLLEIDQTMLGCDVIEENLEGGAELFPHVYGPLKMSAVVRILECPCDDSGRFAEFVP